MCLDRSPSGDDNASNTRPLQSRLERFESWRGHGACAGRATQTASARGSGNSPMDAAVFPSDKNGERRTRSVFGLLRAATVEPIGAPGRGSDGRGRHTATHPQQNGMESGLLQPPDRQVYLGRSGAHAGRREPVPNRVQRVGGAPAALGLTLGQASGNWLRRRRRWPGARDRRVMVHFTKLRL